ncbi:MAG: hypothetical protein HY924_03075 [Elusimicrobia bacterium]|nr:hypothetical protein [Elusimicrobiota bacterium]
MNEEKNCKAEETMCALSSRKAPIAELKNAARGARFICKECGRSARSKELLCAPEEL